MLHFDPSVSCLYASFRPECCLPLVPVGFGPSKQFLGRDFLLAMTAEKAAVGRARKARSGTERVVIKPRG
jgi:hypothetical protein